jgi:hypothetical protein
MPSGGLNHVSYMRNMYCAGVYVCTGGAPGLSLVKSCCIHVFTSRHTCTVMSSSSLVCQHVQRLHTLAQLLCLWLHIYTVSLHPVLGSCPDTVRPPPGLGMVAGSCFTEQHFTFRYITLLYYIYYNYVQPAVGCNCLK